ncbi:MAG: T9SS type A sorting domain-containing protein [Saprospiraceae bacterium]|nr:T9SS type A sorting domain-containing protein [Saprospiraceae bacterium]MBK8485112.1 T9SS type A sorting domain-containing protein [Saprospiraceae bacterium]MBK9223087.1 T9SS type A sorting domain-containing protein [Saprospiraceae bacterium]MBK9720617.1 T9SS type A sorting domain-containing protein [Saprospiraceae bacterium]MBK9727606.1 T9SS type A sorting domain-containing protein [Saprospiraceae bacterium]
MKYSYLIISLLFVQVLVAQNTRFAVSPSPNTIFFVPDMTDHNAHGKIKNKTNANINMLWTREILMLPAAWSTYVCDANNCYADFVGKCPEGHPNIVKPNDSSTLDVHVFDDGNLGEAHIVMWVYEKEDTTKKFKADYSFNKVVTSNREVKNIETKVYPNPAYNSFSVEYNTGLTRIELYSILGKKVTSYQASGKISYDISFLDDGLYFVKLIGPNEQMLRTVRLQKRSYKP